MIMKGIGEFGLIGLLYFESEDLGVVEICLKFCISLKIIGKTRRKEYKNIACLNSRIARYCGNDLADIVRTDVKRECLQLRLRPDSAYAYADTLGTGEVSIEPLARRKQTVGNIPAMVSGMRNSDVKKSMGVNI